MSHASFNKYLLFLACLAPVVAPAQAWLPDKGAFNSTFIFNDVLNKEHWLPNGDTLDVGHTRSQTYALLANYGVTDKVMVSASLPYIITKFWDERGRPSHGGQPGFDVDDGDEHGAFTDLRVGVHYQLLEQPFALAPFIAYVTPVSDYYTRGHAAQGRGLDEVIVGFGAGKSLDSWLRRTYAQMRYSYGFVEEVSGPEARPQQSERRARHLPDFALERQPVRRVAVGARRHRRTSAAEQSLLPESRRARGG